MNHVWTSLVGSSALTLPTVVVLRSLVHDTSVVPRFIRDPSLLHGCEDSSDNECEDSRVDQDNQHDS